MTTRIKWRIGLGIAINAATTLVVETVRSRKGNKAALLASIPFSLVGTVVYIAFREPKLPMPEVAGRTYEYTHPRKNLTCLVCGKMAGIHVEGVGDLCTVHFVDLSWGRLTAAQIVDAKRRNSIAAKAAAGAVHSRWAGSVRRQTAHG